ncbi:MAG: hypothetical protein PHI27_06555 [Eubacteriales bacterium]|nr:hypothetical protein [Eubacteriales bacterium]MDD4513734.1 hypothetical protein [Eubacteriales bacterium]
MRYKANHYTKINGRLYSPGEIVDEAIPTNEAERLTKLGALTAIDAPSVSLPEKAEPPAPPKSEQHDDGEGGEDDGQEQSEDNGDGEDEDEDATEPPPEIDIADGIVDAPESPEPPASEAKKAANKPKRNGGKAR